MQYRPLTLTAGVGMLVGAALGTPVAHADNDNTLIPNNKRFNDSVVANVYTMRHQAGCTNDVRPNPQLPRRAEHSARSQPRL